MAEEEAQAGPVFQENHNPFFSTSSSMTALYHTHQSEFQKIHVVNLVSFGRSLVLDGHMQSAEKDEMAYHELLVHPVMLSHPNPKKVFVGGGGEGATVREILKHKSLEKVWMIDIDGECVDVCKKFLVDHHKNSFDDPRAEIVIDDAKKWLEETKEKFDIIIFDLADPVEGGPCKFLYTQKFYTMAASRLNPGGLLITQSGPGGILTHQQVFSAINKTLGTVFPAVYPSTVHVPSFVDCWSYNIAVTDPKHEDIANLPIDEVDKRIKERLIDPSSLRFYDGLTHRNAYTLVKPLRDTLKNEKRIISEDTPLVIP